MQVSTVFKLVIHQPWLNLEWLLHWRNKVGRRRTESSAWCSEMLCASLRFMAVSNKIGHIKKGNSQSKDDKVDSCSCKWGCLRDLEVIPMVGRSTQPISTEEKRKKAKPLSRQRKDAFPAPESRSECTQRTGESSSLVCYLNMDTVVI